MTTDLNRLSINSSFPIRGLLVCLIGVILMGYMAFLRNMPNAVIINQSLLPFQLTPDEFGNIAGNSMFSYIAMLIVGGILADILNVKFTLSLGIFLSMLGSYFLGHATSVEIFRHSYAMIRISEALILISVLKNGTLWLPKKAFLPYIGLAFAFGMISLTYSQTLLTISLSSLGWSKTNALVSTVGLALFISILTIMTSKTYLNQEVKKISLDEITKIFLNYKIWFAAFIFWLGSLFFTMFVTDVSGYKFFEKMNFSITDITTLMRYPLIGYVIGALFFSNIANVLKKYRSFLTIGYGLSALFFLSILFFNLPKNLISAILFLIGFLLSVRLICYKVVSDNILPSSAAFTFSLMILVSAYGLSINNVIYHFFDLNKFDDLHLSLFVIPIALMIGLIFSLFLSPSKPMIEDNTSIFNDLIRCWNGKERLGRTFWIVHIFGQLIIFNIIYLVFSCFNDYSSIMQFLPLFILFTLPYQLFSIISVWRCAPNTNWIGWKYIARTFVVIWFLQLGYGIFKVIDKII